MTHYDEMSRWYDAMAEGSEGRLRRHALQLLAVQAGERVLEIGCGTGRGLVELAQVGAGQVVGVDLSAGMLRQSQKRVLHITAGKRPALARADGLRLPFSVGYFDVTILSFTLEVFEVDQRAALLGEIRRVISPGGRLGVVALAVGKNGMMERAYQWAHRQFPHVIDCRPIPVEWELAQAGWQITSAERHSMWGLPVAVVIAERLTY